mgnify:CR=1 FL=1
MVIVTISKDLVRFCSNYILKMPAILNHRRALLSRFDIAVYIVVQSTSSLVLVASEQRRVTLQKLITERRNTEECSKNWDHWLSLYPCLNYMNLFVGAYSELYLPKTELFLIHNFSFSSVYRQIIQIDILTIIYASVY